MTAMSGKKTSGRRILPLVILVALASAVGGYGYLFPRKTNGTDRFYLTNAGGPVMFEHRAHFNMAEACASCHHDIVTGEVASQCSDCHDDNFNAGDFDHAALKAAKGHDCVYCHEVDESTPIKSCRDCHPTTQESEPGIVTCPECHDENYSAELMTHDEMLAIEGHTCEICHVVRSVSDVYHEQCDRCHIKQNPAIFVDAEGNSRCIICHLK